VRVNECASPANKRALMDDPPEPSSAPPRGCGRGSVRKKVAQILSATLELSRPACKGHLWIDSIHLRPVWNEVNGKLI
jgi:hypothetical protein